MRGSRDRGAVATRMSGADAVGASGAPPGSVHQVEPVWGVGSAGGRVAARIPAALGAPTQAHGGAPLGTDISSGIHIGAESPLDGSCFNGRNQKRDTAVPDCRMIASVLLLPY